MQDDINYRAKLAIAPGRASILDGNFACAQISLAAGARKLNI